MTAAVEDRFEHLARTCGPRLLGYLARRAGQPADAADLLAEVLLTAWRRIDDIPVADGEALLWLLGVARRVAANQARGAQRRLALADRLRSELQLGAPTHDMGETRLVAEALANLDGDDRELITLIAWEGLSPGQAAVVLGISAPAARKRLQRARIKMRPLCDTPTPPSTGARQGRQGDRRPGGQQWTVTSSSTD